MHSHKVWKYYIAFSDVPGGSSSLSSFMKLKGLVVAKLIHEVQGAPRVFQIYHLVIPLYL